MIRNRKIAILLTIVMVMSLLAAGCGGSSSSDGNGSSEPSSSDKVISVAFGHGFMPNSAHHEAAIKFKEQVEARTDGRVKIELYHSGQLGSARELFEGLQVGSLEITMVPTARISGFAPQLQIFDLPFLFPNGEIRNKVLDGPVGDELLATLDGQGVKGVAFYDDGFKQMTADRPLRSPADFKGLKFRTMESNIIMSQYKALGADPVPIDYAEVYNSLQMGVVNGHENPIVLIHDMKFYEVQDYLMISDHAFLGGVLLYGSNWFDGLSEDIQQVLMEEGKNLVALQRAGVQALEKDNLKVIEDSGIEIITLTDEEKEALREATMVVHEEYRNQYGGEILDKIYAEVDKLK